MAIRGSRTRKDETQGQVAMTVRLPAEVHEALRAVAFANGGSLNDVVLRAIADFLTHKGRRDAVEAMATRVREQYRVALDKLKDL
jgi:predicted transcriptional regulator